MPLTPASSEANPKRPTRAAPSADTSALNSVDVAEQRVRELESALEERDGVVQMLTQRLEQAADQLDRMQRFGSDRRGTAVAGIPTELIESQQTVLDQMTHMLTQWEEMQAAQMLSRIESHISELHDLVSSNVIGHGESRPAHSEHVSASHGHDADKKEPAATQPSAWEAMKAALMAGESVAELPAARSASSEPNTEAAQFKLDCASAELTAPLPAPPAFVNVDEVSLDELRQAVQLRDEFISMLIRRLTSQTLATRLPNWEQLSGAPDGLRDELEELRGQLRGMLRVAEVDLSLQRARLAREESRLQVRAEQIEKKARSVGLTPIDAAPTSNATAKNAAPDNSGTQGRRWLQFLQRSSNSGNPNDASGGSNS